MEDWKDRILEWVITYKKYLLIGVGAVVVGFLMWVVLSEGKPGEPEKSGSREELDVSLEKARELQEVFSEFSRMQIAPSNTLVAYEVDLYLKKPFLSDSDFKKYIEDYVELLKYQVNDKKTGVSLLGVLINVYDREQIYEENLKPRGSVEYQLAEEDKKKSKKEDKYLKDQDMRWDHTITQTEAPDYTKYRYRVNYTEMKSVLGITPLSDEEFEFYLKLSKYAKLQGHSIKGAINLYLAWDLGSHSSLDGAVIIDREFSQFISRHEALGGEREYYDNIYALKKQVAVENPRFLVYALTGEIIDDKVLAKRRLIKLDAEFYLNTFIEDAKLKLEEGEDDTSSQDAVDSDEMTDEELQDIKDNPGTLGDGEEDTGEVWNEEKDTDKNEVDEDIEILDDGSSGDTGTEEDEDDMGEPMHNWEDEGDSVLGDSE